MTIDELEAMRDKDAVLQRKIEYHLARKTDLVKLKEAFLQQFPFVEADDYPAKFLLEAKQLSIPSPKAGLDDFLKNADGAIAATSAKVFSLTDEQTDLREKIDVAQPDLTRCGGFTQARKILWEAQRAGIDVCPHAWLTGLNSAASLHLNAVLERSLFLEYNVCDNPSSAKSPPPDSDP
jgi:hypothetical protein